MTAQDRWAKSDHKKSTDQFAINSDNLNQAFEQYQSMLGAWMKFSQETSRFLNCRIKEDLKAADEISTSKTPLEAAQVQARFIGKMVTDYSTESQNFLGLLAQSSANEISPKNKSKPTGRNAKSGRRRH